MTPITMQPDFREKLYALIKEGYISARKHPTLPLTIFNYTPKAQYDKVWNEVTMTCRGLILDDDGNVVARPFKKFFNYGELEGALPDGLPQVLEKLDGSLGILYWDGDTPKIASRGSFQSEQAEMGTKMLHQLYGEHIEWLSKFKDQTLLFEIIYPDNRIVIDYKGRIELVLLARIHTESGIEMPLQPTPFPVPKTYSCNSPAELVALGNREAEDEEGYVWYWPHNGFRVKFKFQEYCRLHRLVTQTTARSIWDVLRTGRPMSELLERVPDEFYSWVKEKSKEYSQKYEEINRYAKTAAKNAKSGVDIEVCYPEGYYFNFAELKKLEGKLRACARKEFLEKPEYEHICWAFFNNMEPLRIKDLIFDTFYPPHEKPFKDDPDMC